MRRFAIGVVLSCLSALAVAAAPAEIAKKMAGHEYTAAPPGPFPGFDGCMYEGGRSLDDEFGASIIRCGKDYLLTMDRSIGEEGGWPRNRILDAIVLPKFDYHYTSNNDKQLWPDGPCELKGKSGARMEVLLRWGKHERVTSKNGVLAAWGYDLEKGRIIKLDISRIVCEKPDDP